MASAEVRGNQRAQPSSQFHHRGAAACSLRTHWAQQLSSQASSTRGSETPGHWDPLKCDPGAGAMLEEEHPRAERARCWMCWGQDAPLEWYKNIFPPTHLPFWMHPCSCYCTPFSLFFRHLTYSVSSFPPSQTQSSLPGLSRAARSALPTADSQWPCSHRPPHKHYSSPLEEGEKSFLSKTLQGDGWLMTDDCTFPLEIPQALPQLAACWDFLGLGCIHKLPKEQLG